jgi:hypothetical protein
MITESNGFIVVDTTGKVVFDKIYKTQGLAQSVINTGARRGNRTQNQELVVIPMPDPELLRFVINNK